MNWLEVHQLLDREHKRTLAGMKGKAKALQLPDSPETPQQSRALRRATDAACGVFADTQKWAVVEPLVALHLLRRLHQARLFAEFVAAPKKRRRFAEQHAPLNLSCERLGQQSRRLHDGPRLRVRGATPQWHLAAQAVRRKVEFLIHIFASRVRRLR